MSKRIFFSDTEVKYLLTLIQEDGRPTAYANYILTEDALGRLLDKLAPKTKEASK